MRSSSSFPAFAMLLIALFFLGEQALAEDFSDAKTLSRSPGLSLEFIQYAGFSGGVALVDGAPVPLVGAQSGIQFLPWLAVGGFFSMEVLSDTSACRVGLSVADRDGAAAIRSGTELILTPLPGRILHPYASLALGGVSLGYLVDADPTVEGYEAFESRRYFSATLAAGAELNLSRHLRLAGRAAWRLSDGDGFLGLDASDLSGFEASLGLRVLWRTVFD